MRRSIALILPALALFALACQTLRPQPPRPLTIHPIFTSRMVLQRDAEVPIWGWAQPGHQVSVELAGERATVWPDRTGRWEVRFGPFEAGGPNRMTIKSRGATIQLYNILFGEVWIAAGQSNMEWPLTWSENAEQELDRLDWSHIRIQGIRHQMNAYPQDTLISGPWEYCNAESAEWFSAVAYYFGRELYHDLDVPIGLINLAWGGSAMEAWTSEEALESQPQFEWALEQRAEWLEQWGPHFANEGWQEKLDEWFGSVDDALQHVDPGRASFTATWGDLDCDTERWQTIALPSFWEPHLYPQTDGAIWYRRVVTIPPEWAGHTLTLRLGRVDDYDTTFFNGVQVGETQSAPDSFITPRVYEVPGDLVQAGPAVIAARVFDTGGPGGIMGEPEQLSLTPVDLEAEPIPLTGEWLCRPELPLPQDPTVVGDNPQEVPCAIFNAKVNPLIPFAFRGVIWHQGETNVPRHGQCRLLSDTMIADWRARWGEGDFPFLLVQLAGFDQGWEGWPETQWAQWETTQDLPNVWMAVAADLGDRVDIHFRNKREVGRRLALIASAMVYGENVVSSGPTVRAQAITDEGVRLSFDNLGGGLVAEGSEEGALSGFEVCDVEGGITAASAHLEGNDVEVEWDEGAAPVGVRYNWAEWPTGNLFNRAGLPAPMFDTRLMNLE